MEMMEEERKTEQDYNSKFAARDRDSKEGPPPTKKRFAMLILFMLCSILNAISFVNFAPIATVLAKVLLVLCYPTIDL